MISTAKIGLAMFALLALAAVTQPAEAASRACPRDNCRMVRNNYHSRDWYMHRPSTPAERAETARLNREYLTVEQAAPPPAPPPDFRRAPPRTDFRRAPMQYAPTQYAPSQYAPTQYERDLRDYRDAQRRYEQDMRRYEEARNAPARFRQERPRRPLPPRRPARPRRAMTGVELDNDPFGPTGGVSDPDFSAPTPGLDGSTTGLTQFNAHASGQVPRDLRPPRR